jgi:hypothetical protein
MSQSASADLVFSPPEIPEYYTHHTTDPAGEALRSRQDKYDAQRNALGKHADELPLETLAEAQRDAFKYARGKFENTNEQPSKKINRNDVLEDAEARRAGGAGKVRRLVANFETGTAPLK